MKTIPRIIRENGRFCFLVEGRPFIALAAEAHNSAASSPDYMQYVWERAQELHCNTVLLPVYWELTEPRENGFSFDPVKQLITDARNHGMKLILLWFGSFKNGLSTYAPAWIKTNPKRFPRTENETRVKSKTLSMFGSDILAAERNCFKKFIEFLREFDEKEQTVIALQIENEVGILGAARDYSACAAEAFQRTVPVKLMKYLRKTGSDLIKSEADSPNGPSDLRWGEAFGQYADEVFMAWHYARYIDRLAECAKDIYGLPMFTNVWLKESSEEKPGFYPCGGAIPEMMDVWKCGSPHLELLAPDIYTFQFEKFAKIYRRDDNPLFIAETRRDKWAPANLYTAVGSCHALCYSPFGAESIGEDRSFIAQILHTDPEDKNVSGEMVKEYLSLSYKLFGNMIPVLTAYYGTDQMTGFTQNTGQMTALVVLGDYRINIEFYHRIDDDNEFIPGAGIIIAESRQNLIFIGYGYRAHVETKNPGKQLDFLSLEKGVYDENADWIRYMTLNGDEQHIRMEEKPVILRAAYYEF